MTRTRIPTLALVAFLLLGTGAAAEAAAEGGQAAEEVRALLARQAEAWNRGDTAAFTAFYAEDAVFLSPTGITRGRAEVLARYQHRYPDKASMGRLSFEILDLRVAEGSKAVSVAARWHLDLATQEAEKEASGLTLLVLLPRRGGGWEIAQDASM